MELLYTCRQEGVLVFPWGEGSRRPAFAGGPLVPSGFNVTPTFTVVATAIMYWGLKSVHLFDGQNVSFLLEYSRICESTVWILSTSVRKGMFEFSSGSFYDKVEYYATTWQRCYFTCMPFNQILLISFFVGLGWFNWKVSILIKAEH